MLTQELRESCTLVDQHRKHLHVPLLSNGVK